MKGDAEAVRRARIATIDHPRYLLTATSDSATISCGSRWGYQVSDEGGGVVLGGRRLFDL
jgi:hypothetical protein